MPPPSRGLSRTSGMSNHRIGIFVRECQLFAGQSSLPDHIEARRIHLHEFVSRLPAPEEPLEKLVLTGLLFDVAVRWSHNVHVQHHPDAINNCGFDPSVDLLRCWRRCAAAPVTAFAEWATLFLNELDRSHRLGPAAWAKAIVDRKDGHRVSTRTLARQTGCHPGRLRASFKREFGLSIREYQTRRQILEAVCLLVGSELKVDAAARTAGFSSRKNFYSAFVRFVGTNPSTVRRWSHADFENFREQLLPAQLRH